MKLFKYLFWLVIVLIVAVAAVPLNLYYDYISDHLKPLSMEGVHGSLVKGSADSVSHPLLPLRDVSLEWFVYPRSVYGLGGEYRIRHEQLDMRFSLKSLKGGGAELAPLRGRIQWPFVEKYLTQYGGSFDGTVEVDLSQAIVSSSRELSSVSGVLAINDLRMLSPARKDLGRVQMQMETQAAGVIVGQISSESAHMNVSGTLFIQPHRWQLNLDILPRAGEYELEAALRGIGSPRRGGGRHVQMAGFY